MPPLDAPTPDAAAAPSAAPAPKRSGPQRALDKLGLHRAIDLALHLPLRHDDETQRVRIADVRDGQTAQVEGVVRECRVEQRLRRQLLVRIEDGSEGGSDAHGGLLLRFLHFYPSQQKALAVGTRVRARGEVRAGFFGREMVHPAVKPVDAATPLATSLTPVYPTSSQLPQAYLRKAIASALQRAPLDELLPPGVVPAGLPSLRAALQTLHHPPPDVDRAALEDRTHPAWQRLKFDELLAQQLAQVEAKAQRAALRAPCLRPRAGGLHARLLATLPFALTAAQQRVAAEIAHDIGGGGSDGPAPMHRLLQGDVGSGKTVIAALAAAIAIDAGWQCALMAPTELLAEQHFRKLLGWLAPLLREGGLDGDDRIAWLTGSRKGKQRKEMVERVASGRAGLVVGTHAVIQDDVRFARLGLAIVDEQHRFGVQQRLQLRRKLAVGGLEPHLLMMSATPIPRTLAMSYFADLDVSTIDELPPGRTPVVTKLFADDKRAAVVARIRDAVAEGRQVYWVCPLIEESEALDLRNATETHAELQAALPGAQVGLLHGRMAPADKAQVMAAFHAGVLAVLVATTVIEVGVDVPNASLMVIEHAERFGLSQLHQLRGRVGRGSVASVCVLLYTAPLSPAGKARLQAMAQTTDGFEIARRDLEIRGPGDFMGQRQSGDALLRFGDPALDAGLLAAARDAAPALLARHRQAAHAHVQRWLGAGADYLKA